MTEPKEIKSQTLFEGAIFDVVAKEYESEEQGNFKREVIHMHNDAVAVLLWDTEEDDVFTTFEFRSGIGKSIESIPAGKINNNEPELTAVIREVREETGIVLELDHVKCQKISTVNSSEGALDERVHIYAIRGPLSTFEKKAPKFDKDEYVQGAFVDAQTWAFRTIHNEASAPAKIAAFWLENQKLTQQTIARVLNLDIF